MVGTADGCLRTNLSTMLIIAAALTFSSAMAEAEETIQSSCKNGDLVRRVAVVESSLSSGLSCEVVYWKDTEAPGVRQVLWTARQDAGYCYSKAISMVGKLAAMGWTCDSTSTPIN